MRQAYKDRSRRLRLLSAAAPAYSVERSTFLMAALQADKGDVHHRDVKRGLALRAQSRRNALARGNLSAWRNRAEYFDYTMPSCSSTIKQVSL